MLAKIGQIERSFGQQGEHKNLIEAQIADSETEKDSFFIDMFAQIGKVHKISGEKKTNFTT